NQQRDREAPHRRRGRRRGQQHPGGPGQLPAAFHHRPRRRSAERDQQPARRRGAGRVGPQPAPRRTGGQCGGQRRAVPSRTGPEEHDGFGRRVQVPGGRGPHAEGGGEVQGLHLDHARGGPHLAGLLLDRPFPTQRPGPRPGLVEGLGRKRPLVNGLGMPPMSPLSPSALARSVWDDFRRAWGQLVVYEALFKLFTAWLFAPAVALGLSAVLSRAGHIAVSNRDLLAFLLSPLGLLYAGLFSTCTVALFPVEQAGIMALVTRAAAAERPPLKQALLAAFPTAWRVARLSAVCVGLMALTSVPFVLLAVLTYRALLSRHDIYFYLNDRPPAFWLAAGL